MVEQFKQKAEANCESLTSAISTHENKSNERFESTKQLVTSNHEQSSQSQEKNFTSICTLQVENQKKLTDQVQTFESQTNQDFQKLFSTLDQHSQTAQCHFQDSKALVESKFETNFETLST